MSVIQENTKHDNFTIQSFVFVLFLFLKKQKKYFQKCKSEKGGEVGHFSTMSQFEQNITDDGFPHQLNLGENMLVSHVKTICA